MSDDPFEGTGFAAATVQAVGDAEPAEKGTFDLPNNAVDLIGLFLDADIRAARDKIHAQIEASVVRNGGRATGGGVGIVHSNGGVTPAAAQLQKAVVSLHALNKQANRNMANRR